MVSYGPRLLALIEWPYIYIPSERFQAWPWADYNALSDCMYVTTHLTWWIQAFQGEPAPEEGSKEATEVTELCLKATAKGNNSRSL